MPFVRVGFNGPEILYYDCEEVSKFHDLILSLNGQDSTPEYRLGKLQEVRDFRFTKYSHRNANEYRRREKARLARQELQLGLGLREGRHVRNYDGRVGKISRVNEDGSYDIEYSISFSNPNLFVAAADNTDSTTERMVKADLVRPVDDRCQTLVPMY